MQLLQYASSMRSVTFLLSCENDPGSGVLASVQREATGTSAGGCGCSN